MIGCRYGGGGGNIPNVMLSSQTCTRTQKRSTSGFPVAPCGELETPYFFFLFFRLSKLQQNNHICIFSPLHALSKSAKKLVVRAIMGEW